MSSQVVSDAVVGTLEADDGRPRVEYRIAGDAYLLVEYGEVTLDGVLIGPPTMIEVRRIYAAAGLELDL